MNRSINKNNIENYREKLKSNYEDSIKSSILNFIEISHEELLERNNFTEEMLDDIAYAVRENEDFNNYLDSLIQYEIIECIKANNLEEIEGEEEII